jgi:SAM-dependent methyltransferase
LRFFTDTSGQSINISEGNETIQVSFDSSFLKLPDISLTIDIYAHNDHRHPVKHYGWWKFDLTGASNPLILSFDLQASTTNEIIKARSESTRSVLNLVEHWFNPDFPLHPIQDIDMVAQSESAKEELLRFNCYIRNTELLSDYYSREEHQETAYSTTNLVLEEFHKHRIRVFTKIFEHFIPSGSQVLDVGSGYSLIRCCRNDWPFHVTCCDLDEAAMRKMAIDAPDYRWVLKDVTNLPFNNGEFDVVFAGEIIEHLPDPQKGFREWLRVLKPGGVIILSTPNRRRLINIVNHADDPINPEHISELSYYEINLMLKDEGLTILHCEGIYLEWLFNYFRKGMRIDLLPYYCNVPIYRPLVIASMYAGKLFRQWSQDLVYVARKPLING